MFDCVPLEAQSRASLADSLGLLLPAGCDALLSPAARERLARAAEQLPPVPRIAIECRLAEGAGQVDLQQCLHREAGDFDVLAAHLAGHACAGDAPLARLARFCAALIEPEGPLQAVAVLFLELDLDEHSTCGATPSVFVSLPEDPAEGRQVLAEVCSLLLGRPLAPAVDAVFAALQGDLRIVNAGLMIGRAGSGLRLNVKGLLPLDAEGFLDRCGWSGDKALAAGAFQDAVQRADRVTLALDVGERLLAGFGLECFFSEQPAQDRTWEAFLDALCAQGLATPAKAAAFLAVPAEIQPPAAGQDWPQSLIRASLLKGPDAFASVARRATHLKLVFKPDGAREAKAYFAALHYWRDPRKPRYALGAPIRRPSIERRAQVWLDPVGFAIESGAAFLLHRQQQSGLWRDFRMGRDAIADEWVSAFVGEALAVSGREEARCAAERCWQALAASQRPQGGWGWSRIAQPDADSTSWALRLAAALGVEDETTRRARVFLAEHAVTGGGLTTYTALAGRGVRPDLPEAVVAEAAAQPHACVTAAACAVLSGPPLDFLRAAQQDGVWRAYWWVHPAYVTALAAEVLSSASQPGDRERLASACASARGWLHRPEENLSAFDLAFCLRVCLAGRAPAEAAAAAERLLRLQQPDGGWPKGAVLLVPPPWARVTDRRDGDRLLDHARVFSTAAAVAALNRYRGKEVE